MRRLKCEPALRRPIMLIANAHSATPYDEPFVVSTALTPRIDAAATSMRWANLSPSSSPTILTRGAASRTAPVIRGEPWHTISPSRVEANSIRSATAGESAGGGSYQSEGSLNSQ